jgi:hypothetical protein
VPMSGMAARAGRRPMKCADARRANHRARGMSRCRAVRVRQTRIGCSSRNWRRTDGDCGASVEARGRDSWKILGM